mmetsp:Transcript_74341/g.191795  ORF Transcript_74341/g.191795 Transcript_74341/m.191795 type:complete len:296 (+) Transcript_74341:1-888(+)
MLDTGHDGGEVVVLQHDVGRVLRHVRASDAHGDAHLGLLQGRRIVDAITSHGANVADAAVPVLLVGLHDDLLVDRRHAREHTRVLRRLLPPLDNLWRLLIGEVVRLGHPALEHGSGDNAELVRSLKLLAFDVLRVALEDVDAAGDGAGRVGVVACDHDHLDSSALRAQHGIVHTVLRRVLDAVEADEVEVLHGEVAILRARALEDAAWRQLRDLAPRDCEHAPSLGHELLHLGLDLAQGHAITLHRAVLQHAVRSALEHREGLPSWLAMDGKHPLVLRVEGDLEELVVLRPVPRL